MGETQASLDTAESPQQAFLWFHSSSMTLAIGPSINPVITSVFSALLKFQVFLNEMTSSQHCSVDDDVS